MKTRSGSALAIALFGLPVAVHTAEVAPRILLLDGAVSGPNVIAVGERGAIVISSDNARTWARIASPAKATLTGISFAPASAAQTGWAVGHDALILGTTDGGRTWTKQSQGENLQDSFLDVLALDAQHAITVGAYGLYAATTDGGKTWARRKLSNEDYHFNRLTAGAGTTLYLAGEHGTLLRSNDRGAKWAALKSPYEGSFYGLVSPVPRVLLAHGLRGRVYRSVDDGRAWTQVTTPDPVLLATAVKLRAGPIVLGGQSRALLVSRDGGATFAAVPEILPGSIAKLLELPDGNLLALGEAGATVIEAGRLAPGSAPASATRAP